MGGGVVDRAIQVVDVACIRQRFYSNITGVSTGFPVPYTMSYVLIYCSKAGKDGYAIIKSIVFGFVVTWIAVFEGYDSVPTSQGVSHATTRTVVHSSLAILALDFVLTALMFGDY